MQIKNMKCNKKNTNVYKAEKPAILKKCKCILTKQSKT